MRPAASSAGAVICSPERVSLKDLRKGEQLTVSAEAAADMILDDIADNLKGTIWK